MSLLDEPIEFPSFRELLSFPVLAGAGVGVFAAYGLFKTPSIAQVLGASLLGGLGGYTLGGRTIGGASPSPTASPSGLGNAWDQLADRVEEIFKPPLPSPTPTSGGTKPVNNIAPGGIMSPQTAYNLVQAGKYQVQVKFAKMSRYYNWGDLMVSNSISEGNRKSIPLSAYVNAAKLGLGLDKLVQATGGKKIPVNSWHRIQRNSSNHTTGGAADLGGLLSYAYIKNTLYPAARRISDFKGVGYPTISTHKSLHLDILANHGCPANMQYDFQDNGDGNYPGACRPVLGVAVAPTPKPVPAPAPRPNPLPLLNLFAPRPTTKASILPKPGSISLAPPPPRRLPYIPVPIFYPSPPASAPSYGAGEVSGSIIRYN